MLMLQPITDRGKEIAEIGLAFDQSQLGLGMPSVESDSLPID